MPFIVHEKLRLTEPEKAGPENGSGTDTHTHTSINKKDSRRSNVRLLFLLHENVVNNDKTICITRRFGGLFGEVRLATAQRPQPELNEI